MRHRKKKTMLNKKTAARRSLLANLAESLILYEKITTTKAKAKALRSLVENLINKAKEQTLAGRREITRILYTKNAVDKLMDKLGPRYKDRRGGCSRIILLSSRKGDGSERAIIELIK